MQQEVDAHEKRVKRVKETTLALLGKKDPELADDIAQSKRFTETLAGMVQEAEYSPDTIKENLEMYEDYLKKSSYGFGGTGHSQGRIRWLRS